MTIYPEFIAPLFDKYIPLPQSQLKDKIEELASRLNYPLKKLFVVQGSKRSAHSNAYMYGFWNNKRIVLYDTLLSEELNEDLKAILDTEKPSDSKLLIDKKDDEMTEGESSFNSFENNEPKTNEETKKNKKLGMNDDEVVAVLGHELGHWKLWHSFYNLVIMEINSFILLAVFAYFYRQESIYAAFGFVNQPPIIGLLLIMQFVMLPYNEVVSVIMSFHSRYAEFAADKFSADLGYTDLLCSALIKLGKDNLSLPIDDPLYSAIHHSHPPTPERIAALQKNK